jgi:hypothetical protein
VVAGGAHLLWEPRRATWWLAVLFAAGSMCFLVGPLPVFLNAVGPRIDAVVFFVGSLLFTSAATLQWRESSRAKERGLDWWSSTVQLAGTLFFNATTFRALSISTDSSSYDQVVWRPDAFGSVCFLVSGLLAYALVAGGLMRRPPRTKDSAIATVNLFGCIAFGLAALGAYVLPASGSEVSAAIGNGATALGALAFLVGSLLLLVED